MVGSRTELSIDELTIRPSMLILSDGAKIELSITVRSIYRRDGQFDDMGNPIYDIELQPSMRVVSVALELRRKAN